MKASFNRLAARYLQAEAGLGRAFLDEYEVWEKRTRRFPESCPEIAPGIRGGFLARFKYHVTYTRRSDTLRILYVRSARQIPLKKWQRT